MILSSISTRFLLLNNLNLNRGKVELSSEIVEGKFLNE